MSSSEDKPINTRDFRYVYVRRRRRITTGSGRVVRDLDLNAPPPSEPASMPKTDGSFEIGDDSPVSPARNLFQREVIIPRKKRSTINRKPRRYLRWRIVQFNSAPGKEWRCPTCLRIDNDELSKPIIYLKQLKSKKGIKKSEG